MDTKFRVGDKIRFSKNGVLGVVISNHGPAINTENGHDSITWRVLYLHTDGGSHLGDMCTHNASQLELAD